MSSGSAARIRHYWITLHSYRYAWADAPRPAVSPERFAQEALGHNSKAVHRAYSKKAQVKVPALEDYEKSFQQSNVIPVQFPKLHADSSPAAAAVEGARGEQQGIRLTGGGK